ncbi:arginine--tRNA ligase [Candidatus Woesearchaeota archaeon CG10_big_fil_rev_8_21_14_0_10_37_12]|nr:MAG: arginine--tRNA ligase [Candidatus Woesearchaeota archaeon CG10_big_fil_rev_8_21_14_0_10_37_12]
MFEQQIINELQKHIKGEINLEVPPDSKLGDFAFACFSLAKELKKSPVELAKQLAEEIEKPEGVEKVAATGPYVNFFLDKSQLAKELVKIILKEKEKYGESNEGKGKTIVVEYSSPNTNKPLHLGHLRNIFLGDSICNLYASQGFNAVRTQIVNDRGVHICKSMLAYKLFNKGDTPDSTGRKSDHFVGDYYVKFAEEAKKNPELETQAQEMLVKWEEGDKDVLKLWKLMKDWCEQGYDQTYENLSVDPGKLYYESDIYLKGKEIALEGLKKGVFKKDENGAIIVEFDESKKLDKKVLVRSDGTAVYITQDLYLDVLRYDEYQFDEMIHVVGNEQEYHFQVLFEVFKLLGHEWADGCYHLSYGMVELPEGKMKSREGTVVDADDLLLSVEDLSREEITKRYADLQEEELHERAHAVGLGALRFMLLHVDPKKKIVFDPKQAISFEGDTGPYLLYTHARAASILDKAEKFKEAHFKTLSESEIQLVLELSKFKQAIQGSLQEKSPHVLVQYLIKLGRAFNEFYHHNPVLKATDEEKQNRLQLVFATKQVLKNGLHLLGIRAIDQM